MTESSPQGNSDELTPSLLTTYDLIICHENRIVFHEHYESPEQRQRACVWVLMESGVLAGIVTSDRSVWIMELHSSLIEQQQTRPPGDRATPDEIVDALAEACREWDVQLYMSTTAKKSGAPRTLYSVITEYGPGQTVAEHFTDRESRTASLIERAEHFFASPGNIPAVVLSDEQRLAALVATLLMPATVTLTESVLDETEGVYRPDNSVPQVR
ncbi:MULTISPECIES: hypothetical protein [unclassified Streptomyces]|uniref:hypothetical protein n=1 Tax=unclassified Streptomyces TaxID=2593676 RepID=UPI002DD8D93A|nr:hypothetical protein [Streptomyces sp. NBC_01768]WSC32329.1 hypothetical protein OG902_39725 [Streptomyces sp. NBC_01768]WSX06375.1 hypothetical protein OG355_41365 [Streptomyces sp. NBC_00987]